MDTNITMVQVELDSDSLIKVFDPTLSIKHIGNLHLVPASCYGHVISYCQSVYVCAMLFMDVVECRIR